jgi:hypothetical protein
MILKTFNNKNFILIFCLIFFFGSCHNKYKGLCKEDRRKMQMVDAMKKAQAKGSCPADKARIKKEQAEKKLSEKSKKQATKQ